MTCSAAQGAILIAHWGAGYEGMYMNKAGKAREGCATFFRRDRFTRVAQVGAHYSGVPEAFSNQFECFMPSVVLLDLLAPACTHSVACCVGEEEHRWNVHQQ